MKSHFHYIFHTFGSQETRVLAFNSQRCCVFGSDFVVLAGTQTHAWPLERIKDGLDLIFLEMVGAYNFKYDFI